MRYVLQLLIIIAFSFMGELLHHLLPFPIPASIYGIALLFAALELRIVKTSHIRQVSTTLIIAMPVMFIPPAVGLTNTWQQIASSWPSYLLITILTTFMVMAISGWATQLIIRNKNKKKCHNS